MTIPWVFPGAECRLGQACVSSPHDTGMDVVLSAKGKEKEARKVKEPANKRLIH